MDYHKELLQIEKEISNLNEMLLEGNQEEILEIHSLENERKKLMEELNRAILSSVKHTLLQQIDEIEKEQKVLQSRMEERKETIHHKISALNQRKYKLEEQKYLHLTRQTREKINNLNSQNKKHLDLTDNKPKPISNNSSRNEPDVEKKDNLSLTFNIKKFKSELAEIKNHLKLAIDMVIALEEKINQEQPDENEIYIDLELEELRKQLREI